jgi:hypothetical protein
MADSEAAAHFLSFIPASMRAEAASYERAEGISLVPLWNVTPGVRGILGFPAVALRPAAAARVRGLLSTVVVERGPPLNTARWIQNVARLLATAYELMNRPNAPPADGLCVLLSLHLALSHADAQRYLFEGFSILEALWLRDLPFFVRYSVAWKLALLHEDRALGLDPHIPAGDTADRTCARAHTHMCTCTHTHTCARALRCPVASPLTSARSRFAADTAAVSRMHLYRSIDVWAESVKRIARDVAHYRSPSYAFTPWRTLHRGIFNIPPRLSDSPRPCCDISPPYAVLITAKLVRRGPRSALVLVESLPKPRTISVQRLSKSPWDLQELYGAFSAMSHFGDLLKGSAVRIDYAFRDIGPWASSIISSVSGGWGTKLGMPRL